MNTNGSLLFVDDDKDVLLTAKIILEPYFKNLVLLDSPEEIIDQMHQQEFDVIVLDMNFSTGQTSGTEGIFWLRKVLQQNPEAHVLMNTAYADINLAVNAMKEGAVDFIVKPWEKSRLIASVLSVYELSKTKKENKKLKIKTQLLAKEIDQQFPEIISKARSMKPVFEIIKNVSQTDANVLILGENGTGKELVARMIHRNSERSKHEFVNVDLGSISESLFESELFGHKKGSFTDAKEDRMGRFELAANGTLFLDEIGNIKMAYQAKLLSAIQKKEIHKVGSSNPIKTDVRLICATNKPIYQMTVSDEFRQDLLYRINTVEIHLPPLRDRIEDIPFLATHFLEQFKRKYNKDNQYIIPEAIKKLQQYNWPGNIRELQHMIERVVILSKDAALVPDQFALSIIKEDQDPSDKNFKIESIEKSTIKEVLKSCNGNMTLAAKELGYARSTLYRKIEKYGL